MDAKNAQPGTVDAYIAQFPEDIQQILLRIRAVIKEAAPEAEERIGYGMPGYYLNGGLVWFAAFKRHIGLYPAGYQLEAFEAELSSYKRSKGTVQFPLDQPIPYELIGRIVKYRVEQNLSKK